MSTSLDPPVAKPFKIQRVTWQDAEPDLRILREFIFIKEQNVPPELEWDGEDENAVHVLARDEKGRGIGTARMTTTDTLGAWPCYALGDGVA